MLLSKRFDGLVTAPCVQGHEKIGGAAVVVLADDHAMAQPFQNARPPLRGHAVALPRTRRRWTGHEDLYALIILALAGTNRQSSKRYSLDSFRASGERGGRARPRFAAKQLEKTDETPGPPFHLSCVPRRR